MNKRDWIAVSGVIVWVIICIVGYVVGMGQPAWNRFIMFSFVGMLILLFATSDWGMPR